MKRLLTIVMLAAAWTAGAQGTTEAILGYNALNAVSGQISGTAGWSFEVTNAVTVTELGCIANVFTKNTDVTEVQIGMWASSGTLLASSVIRPTNSPVNLSLYGEVTPVLIGPGQTYYIGAYSSGTFFLDVLPPAAESSVTTSPVITSLAAAYSSGGFLSPLALPNTAGAAFLGPNFLYTGVPEPSASLLLGLGAVFLAARRRIQRR